MCVCVCVYVYIAWRRLTRDSAAVSSAVWAPPGRRLAAYRCATSEALPVLPGGGIRRRTPMYPAITTFSLN